jgi:hypothetical protein
LRFFFGSETSLYKAVACFPASKLNTEARLGRPGPNLDFSSVLLTSTN